jgi:hypothetical protein
MTPKEKAGQLIYIFAKMKVATSVGKKLIGIDDAKLMALECVNEVIMAMPDSAHITMKREQKPFKIMDYWEEVKKQITIFENKL